MGMYLDGRGTGDSAIKVGPQPKITSLMTLFIYPMAEEEPHIHDVLIIGAGPCGLAVAVRLCESTPSAFFTDSEH